MLEGSPGLGKSALVTTLAKMTQNPLVRINLSDQTEISDLFGSDLPTMIDGNVAFEWHDGPLLAALKAGHWVLLDELNLATQSVLEGLNACLDHRGEVFIPELNKSFQVMPGKTRIFATQNPPREGGDRKNLPKSFLNRFIKVHLTSFAADDIGDICNELFGKSVANVDVIESAVKVADSLTRVVTIDRSFGHHGGPWQFNLRDIIRFCQGISFNVGSENILSMAKLIFVERFRSDSDRKMAQEILERNFKQSSEVGNTPCLKIKDSTVTFGSGSQVKEVHKQQLSYRSQDNFNPDDCIVMESLLKCTAQKWLAILIGNSSLVNLSAYVQNLAALLGHKLNIITISSSTDTTELLGGFEQTSGDLIASQVVEHCMTKIDEAVLKNKNNPSVIKELLKSKLAITGASNLETLTSAVSSCLAFSSEESSMLVQKLQDSGCQDGLGFEWIDSVLIKAVKTGDWVLLDGANKCNPSVLDRLNSLLEEDRILALGEKGCRDGIVPSIKAHDNFRLFVSVDTTVAKELSPALRNRGVEIFVKGQDQGGGQLSLGSLVRHGESYVIVKQLELARDLAVITKERSLLAFFAQSTANDWICRQEACRIAIGNPDFQHPAKDFSDPLQLWTILEQYYVNHNILNKSMSVHRTEHVKSFWQNFCNLVVIVMSVSTKQGELHLGQVQRLSLILEHLLVIVNDKYKDDADIRMIFAVLWKLAMEVTKIDSEEIREIVHVVEDNLLTSASRFEAEAVKFANAIVSSDTLKQDPAARKAFFSDWTSGFKTVIEGAFEIMSIVIKNILEKQQFLTAQADLQRSSLLLDNLSLVKLALGQLHQDQLFQGLDPTSHSNCDPMTLVMNKILFREVKNVKNKAEDQENTDSDNDELLPCVVSLQDRPRELAKLKIFLGNFAKASNDCIKALKDREQVNNNYAVQVAEALVCQVSGRDNLADGVAMLAHKVEVDCSLNKSVKEIAESYLNYESIGDYKTALKSIVASGVFMIAVAGERGDVDVAQAMETEMDLFRLGSDKCEKDLMAVTSLERLTIVNNVKEEHVNTSDRVHSHLLNSLAEAKSKMADLEGKIPIRSEAEKYSDLVVEIRRISAFASPKEVLDSMVQGLERARGQQEQSLASNKIANWLRSSSIPMSNLPEQFSTFEDVWMPVLQGLALISIGLSSLLNLMRSSWRQSHIAVYDSLRQLGNLKIDPNNAEKSREEGPGRQRFKLGLLEGDSNLQDLMQSYSEVFKTLKKEFLTAKEAEAVHAVHVTAIQTCAFAMDNNPDQGDPVMNVTKIEKVLTQLATAIREKKSTTTMEDLLKAIDACLNRRITEEPAKFLLPLERLSNDILAWNKNCPMREQINTDDLDSLLCNWRMHLNKWKVLEADMNQRLVRDVQDCGQALVPLLDGKISSVKSTCLPFALFCHTGFLGDFGHRLEAIRKTIGQISNENPGKADHLRAILDHFEAYSSNVSKDYKRELKVMQQKYHVQESTRHSRKVIYDKHNITNNFKVAQNIGKTAKMGMFQLAKKSAMKSFVPSKQENTVTNILSTWTNGVLPDVEIACGGPEAVSSLKVDKVVTSAIANLNTNVNETVIGDVDSWLENMAALEQDLVGKKDTLTYHIFRTKLAPVLEEMKRIGLRQAKGAKLDVRIANVLQELRLPEGGHLCRDFVSALHFAESLSSALLLNVGDKTSGPKPQAGLCQAGQDLLAHGLVVVGLKQNLKRIDLDRQSILVASESLLAPRPVRNFKLISLLKRALQLTWVHLRTTSASDLTEMLAGKLINSLKQLKESSQDFPVICGSLASDEQKEEIRQALPVLAQVLDEIELIPIEQEESNLRPCPGRLVQVFQETLETAFNSAFLSMQTVIKQVKNNIMEDNFNSLGSLLIKWIDMLNFANFRRDMVSLAKMTTMMKAKNYDTSSLQNLFESKKAMLQLYLKVFKSLQDQLTQVSRKSSQFFEATAKLLVKVLKHKFVVKDDDDKNDEDGEGNAGDSKSGQTSADGQPEDGVGLGDGEGEKATTDGVTSEDMLEGAERPDAKDHDGDDGGGEDEKPDKKQEEDGFEVDMDVAGEAQSESEGEEHDRGQDSEDEEAKEQEEAELETEEGKADEKLDKDMWDDLEDEEEEGSNKDESLDQKKQDRKQNVNNDEDQERTGKQDQAPDPDDVQEQEEDPEKRQRKPEELDQDDDEEPEVDMADNQYGNMEPPEAEDLDLGEDGAVGDDDNAGSESEDEYESEPDEGKFYISAKAIASVRLLVRIFILVVGQVGPVGVLVKICCRVAVVVDNALFPIFLDLFILIRVVDKSLQLGLGDLQVPDLQDVGVDQDLADDHLGQGRQHVEPRPAGELKLRHRQERDGDLARHPVVHHQRADLEPHVPAELEQVQPGQLERLVELERDVGHHVQVDPDVQDDDILRP